LIEEQPTSAHASFVAQRFVLIETSAIVLARSIVVAGRSQIRSAHRDCNVRWVKSMRLMSALPKADIAALVNRGDVIPPLTVVREMRRAKNSGAVVENQD
jgi:hypothetical protein